MLSCLRMPEWKSESDKLFRGEGCQLIDFCPLILFATLAGGQTWPGSIIGRVSEASGSHLPQGKPGFKMLSKDELIVALPRTRE